MREVMIGLGLLMAALSLVIVYSALIVASECDDLEEEEESLREKLAAVGFFYDAEQNRFR